MAGTAVRNISGALESPMWSAGWAEEGVLRLRRMKTRSGESISSFYSTRVTTSPNLPTDPPSLIITDSNLAPRTTHAHLQLTTRGAFKVIREEKSARAEGPFCGRITILSLSSACFNSGFVTLNHFWFLVNISLVPPGVSVSFCMSWTPTFLFIL